MEINVSKYAGFCFGVKRAVDMAGKLLDGADRGKIYSLGDIIHNKHVMDSLRQKGLTVISPEELDTVCASANEQNPCTVLIRAHGIELEIENKLQNLSDANAYFNFCDLTCPLVKKIHGIVKDNTSSDTELIVYGDEKHPEVRGIVGRADGKVSVVSSPCELELYNFTNKMTIMVAQTTKKLYEWEKCKKILNKLCTNSIFFDTICDVTENRQNDVLRIAENAELTLVIGDKSSSNSLSLLALARSVCDNSYLIESAEDLRNISLMGINKVAITAGASTPSHIIEEVIKTMSEFVNTNEQANESFASMLESSLKTLNTGDIVTGIITSISNTEIHVDLACKGTGILSVDEIRTDANTDVRSLYNVGDEIEAFVVRVSDVEGVAGLSRRRIDRIADWKKIKAAAEEGATVEGKITEVVKGGVIATVGNTKVFIPASQTGVPASGDLNEIVGTTQSFIIIEVNDQKNRAVGSIRAILRRERKAMLEQFWANMEVGKKFSGTVKSMTSYGVFVDLGGVDGMVHVSELSWSRIKDPSEVVKVGDSIDVFVKSFDVEKKRISLGCKTEDQNPWKIFTAQYAVGDVANVKVVGITPFGAFAEIVPEVDGLIHISQIADKRIANPSEVLEIGQNVDAKITAIDDEKQKVSLSIRALLVPETVEEVEEEATEGEALVYSSDDPTSLPAELAEDAAEATDAE